MNDERIKDLSSYGRNPTPEDFYNYKEELDTYMEEREKANSVSKLEYPHLVILIGDEETGSLKKVREECAFLNERAAHNDIACLNCGDYFPFGKLLPISFGIANAITDQFMKEHMGCKKR